MSGHEGDLEAQRMLTDKGWDLITRNKGKVTYDIERLMEVARLI